MCRDCDFSLRPRRGDELGALPVTWEIVQRALGHGATSGRPAPPGRYRCNSVRQVFSLALQIGQAPIVRLPPPTRATCGAPRDHGPVVSLNTAMASVSRLWGRQTNSGVPSARLLSFPSEVVGSLIARCCCGSDGLDVRAAAPSSSGGVSWLPGNRLFSGTYACRSLSMLESIRLTMRIRPWRSCGQASVRLSLAVLNAASGFMPAGRKPGRRELGARWRQPARRLPEPRCFRSPNHEVS